MNAVKTDYLLEVLQLYSEDIEDVVIPPALKVEEPPITNDLSESQMAGFKSFISFFEGKLKDESGRPFNAITLNGEAGSGKSYLIGKVFHQLLHELQKSNSDTNICFCAPTWDAVAILSKMSRIKHDRVTYLTAQSLCGMRASVDFHGNTQYTVVEGKDKFNDFSIIVVDEASQIDSQLFNVFMQKSYDKLFVFIGDEGQLPPVGEDVSPVFNEKNQRITDPEGEVIFTNYSIYLREQMRTTDGNPGRKLALAFRNKESMKELKKTSLTDEGFLVYQPINKNRVEDLYPFFKEAYGDRYKVDPNYFKLICYTTTAKGNATSYWTKHIRKALFGNDPDYIIKGETIKLTQPLTQGDVTLFTNKTELRILTDPKEEDYYLKEAGWHDHEDFLPCYIFQVEVVGFEGETHTVRCLTEEGESLWKHARKEIWAEVRRLKETRQTTQHLVSPALKLDNSTFIFFRHDYVRSAHTAQGSTFTFSACDTGDLRKALTLNRNAVLFSRLNYVALTRFRKGMILFTDE